MGRGQVSRKPQILVPPDEKLGPAMLECTPAQRAFVVAMVSGGANNATQAAMVAGYGGTDDAKRAAAKHLMRTPKVLAALREEADKFMISGVLVGARAVMEIAMDPLHKDRLKAAVYLQERAGLQVTTKHEITVKDTRTPDDVIRSIVDMAKKNNLDPKALLGFDPELPVVEGEFEVKSTEGLEDVL
jgi:phage terminase small subunit